MTLTPGREVIKLVRFKAGTLVSWLPYGADSCLRGSNPGAGCKMDIFHSNLL